MSYLDIAKKAEEKLKGGKAEATPLSEVAEDKTIQGVPPCWICGAITTETTDIYGVSVWVCDPCTVSSDDVLPDLVGQMPRAWGVEEVREGAKLRAVLICSALLEDHFWVVLDKTFMPPDGSAIYYPEELPLLKDQTPEHLRLIHNAKIGFPGCRIIQEGPEAAVESAA